MLHQRHKQIEPKARPTPHHLRLHRAAALENLPPANDQREVVGAQAAVAGGRVSVRETGGGQDRGGV